MINVPKLTDELKAAGISDVTGCNSNGVVWGVDGMVEIQTREDVAAVIAAHDSTEPNNTPTIEERLEAAELLIAALLEV